MHSSFQVDIAALFNRLVDMLSVSFSCPLAHVMDHLERGSFASSYVMNSGVLIHGVKMQPLAESVAFALKTTKDVSVHIHPLNFLVSSV